MRWGDERSDEIEAGADRCSRKYRGHRTFDRGVYGIFCLPAEAGEDGEREEEDVEGVWKAQMVGIDGRDGFVRYKRRRRLGSGPTGYPHG